MLGNDLPIWGCCARLDCVTTEDCARMVAVTVASRQRKNCGGTVGLPR
ncbi:hypothetical protein HTY54_19505 [Escherichia coli]|nr:hypothetical protein [Escherichia coli]